MEAKLRDRKLKSHIHREGKRPSRACKSMPCRAVGKPLTEQAKGSNRTKSSVRVRVEHIFDAQANDMSDLVAIGSRPIANGQLAKTDRVPSRRCKHRLSGNERCDVGQNGRTSGVEGRLTQKRTLHDLKQLATARLALIKDQTAAKARLAATTIA